MSDESEFKSKQQKQHNEEETQDDVDQQVNNVDHLLQVKCTIEEEEQQQKQQKNDDEAEEEGLQQKKSFNIPGIFIEKIGESSSDEPLTILRECDTNVEAKYRQSDPNPKSNQDICETKNKHAASRSISNYPITSNDETDDNYSSSTQLSSSKLSLVYDSKEIPPIIEELIRTEETYIKNLKIGIHNYGKILNGTNKNLPKGLRGKKLIILGNIEQICEFHDIEFLPMLIRNQFNLKDLFDDFMKLIDENCFYSYVLYTMNKKRSIKLCEQYRQYFKSVQEELNDKLGINSFLVQPIQRLARYPLLLQQFIMTCFKTGNIKYKPIIESCCKVEKRVRNLLTTTNEAEEINDIEECNDINIFHQGKFKKMNEFNVYDYTQRRSYRSKVFIFDKCLLYTEIRDKRLIFRGYYPCEYIGFISKLKSFTLYYHKQKYQECEFTADKQILDLWIELIRDMIRLFAEDEKRKLKEKYSNSNNSSNNNTNNSNNYNGYRQCDIYRRPSSILLLRNSSRLSTDSGTNISVFSGSSTSSTNSQEENSPRTTWYADTFDTL